MLTGPGHACSPQVLPEFVLLSPNSGADPSHRCGRSPRPATAAARDARAEPRGSAEGPAPPSPGLPSAAGRGSHGRPAALLLHTGPAAAPRRTRPGRTAVLCRAVPSPRRSEVGATAAPRRPSPAPHGREAASQPPLSPQLPPGPELGGFCTPHPRTPPPDPHGRGACRTHPRSPPPRNTSEEGTKAGAPFSRYGLRWGACHGRPLPALKGGPPSRRAQGSSGRTPARLPPHRRPRPVSPATGEPQRAGVT